MEGDSEMNSISKGYKKTEIGVIPEDWEEKKLDDICEKIIGGGTPSRNNKIYWNGKIPWATVKDLSSFNANNTQEYITEEGLRESSSTLIPAGTIILATRMLIGQPVIYNCNVAINQDLKALFFSNGYNKYFLSYVLSDRSKELVSSSSGSTVLGLSVQDLRTLNLILPPLPEQKAIAEALSDMDALIKAQKELISKKRDIKQGTMQDLLSGRARLPGYKTKGWKHTDIGDIPDDWEVKELKNIGIFSKGKGISRSEVKEQGKPCLRYGEIYTIYDTVVHTLKSFISDESTSTSKRLYSGDIIFAASGETSAEIAKNITYVGEEDAYVGGDTIILTPRDQDSIFLSYLLDYYPISKQKSKIGQGDAVVHVHISNLEKIIICVPSLSEQQAIAQVLSDMDDEIETLEAELEKLHHMKRGMMQELLTGRIRLI